MVSVLLAIMEQKDLFSTPEHYRKSLLNKSNNDWFKSETKAYIVEEKSNIEEVKLSKGLAGTKYLSVSMTASRAIWKWPQYGLASLLARETCLCHLNYV